jgi:hypothetical protein
LARRKKNEPRTRREAQHAVRVRIGEIERDEAKEIIIIVGTKGDTRQARIIKETRETQDMMCRKLDF